MRYEAQQYTERKNISLKVYHFQMKVSKKMGKLKKSSKDLCNDILHEQSQKKSLGKKSGISMWPDKAKKRLKQGKNSYSFTDTFPPTLLLMGQKREKGEVIHHCDSRNHTSSLQKSTKTRKIEGKIRLFRIQVDTICTKKF